MIIKYNSITDTSTVKDIFKYIEDDNKIGQAWLGKKDSSTFYEKEQITYGEWNFIQVPEIIDTASWDSNLVVSINAYTERTNSIRRGFTYSSETEREYAVITIKGTTDAGTLTGNSGETGYKFTWNTYDNTTSDRTVTLVATCDESNITKEIVITLKARDKYVTNISNIKITGYDLYNYSTLATTKVNSSDFIIPACGGKISKVYYKYDIVYNTGETVEQNVAKDAFNVYGDNIKYDIKANSLGTTEKEKQIICTVSNGTLGTITVENITEDLVGFTVYQEANTKTSNNDAYTLTKNIELTSDKDKIYVNGGDIKFTVTRTYDSYSDTYTYTSGETSNAVLSAGKTEPLTSCDIDVTGGASCSFNNLTYTIGKKEIETTYTFKAKYIGDKDTAYSYSNEIIITLYMDAKKEDSDTFVQESFEITELKYRNISEEIPYTFSASGGTLSSNDTNRIILSYSYKHKWVAIENGVETDHEEIITGTFKTLTTNEYSFDKSSVTANNLGIEEKDPNDNLNTITITITPYYNNKSTNLSLSKTATLTQEGNTKSNTIVEGSEVSKRLNISVTPTTLSYTGGDVTLKATYYYTVKYTYTSGSDKDFDENIDVTTDATWFVNEDNKGTISTGKYNISSISETDPSKTFVFKANYKLDSENEVTVILSAVAIVSDVWSDLKINEYLYDYITNTDYHIPASGGTVNAADYSKLSATVCHVITYANGVVDGVDTDGNPIPIEVNLSDSNIKITYDKALIKRDSLGTTEASENENLGTFTVTITGTWDSYVLKNSKESNTIYRLLNKKSDTYTKIVYNNVIIASPANEYKIPTTGEIVNFKLTYDKAETYTYTSGESKDFTNNIDGTSDSLFYLTNDSDDEILLDYLKQSYYIFDALEGLEDINYTLSGRITLNGTKYDTTNSIKLIQIAKTIAYYKDLKLTLSINNSITDKYTLPASGGTISDSDIKEHYEYTIVYDDGSTDTTTTDVITGIISVNIGNLTSRTNSITYGSKGTVVSDNTKVNYNNQLVDPLYFEFKFVAADLTDNNGNGLSATAKLTVYQEANVETSNNDAYTYTTDLILSSDKQVIYVKGGDIKFTVTRKYKSYSDSYTYTSGAVRAAVETTDLEDKLTSCDISVTGGVTGGSFNNLTYTIPEKSVLTTYNFQAKYKADTDSNTSLVESNIIEVILYMDSKIEGSDSYSNLKILEYSYSYISNDIQYTMGAAGGSFTFNDKDRITVKYSYLHTWTVKENGVNTPKDKIEEKEFKDLTSSEYSFNASSNTTEIRILDGFALFPTLGTTEQEGGTVEITITITLSDKNNISADATTTLTLQPNKKNSNPIEGTETPVKVDVTCSPDTLTYEGGNVTLKALYTYTVKYAYTSDSSDIFTETKDITKSTTWYVNDEDKGIISDGIYNVSSIDQTLSERTFTFKTTYNGKTGEATVTQSAVTITSDEYTKLEITTYKYDTISGTNYHILASGGNVLAGNYSTLTVKAYHTITYSNGLTSTLEYEIDDISTLSISYKLSSILMSSLGTSETTSLTDCGKFTITISGTFNGKDLSDTKESNTIYQLINSKTETSSSYHTNYNLSIKPTDNKVPNAGGTVSLCAYLDFDIIGAEYKYTSGSTSLDLSAKIKDKNISTPVPNEYGYSATWTCVSKTNNSGNGGNIESIIVGDGKNATDQTYYITIGSRSADTLVDDIYTVLATLDGNTDAKTYIATTTITLVGDTITKTYYKDLTITCDYDKYLMSDTDTDGKTYQYHYTADGKNKNGDSENIDPKNGNVSATATRVDVYELLGEVETTGVNIEGEWKYTELSNGPLNLTNNIHTDIFKVNTIVVDFTSTSDYLDINGKVLTESIDVYLYQLYNKLTYSYKDLKTIKTSPETIYNQTSEIILLSYYTKTSTYTSGYTTSEYIYCYATYYITNNNITYLDLPQTKLDDNTTKINITILKRANGTTDNDFIGIASFYKIDNNNSLLNITTLTRYGDTVEYSNLKATLTYNSIDTDNYTNEYYHIPASGGTINIPDDCKSESTIKETWTYSGLKQVGRTINADGTFTAEHSKVEASDLKTNEVTENTKYTVTYTFTADSKYNLSDNTCSGTLVFNLQTNIKSEKYTNLTAEVLDKNNSSVGTNDISDVYLYAKIYYKYIFTSGAELDQLESRDLTSADDLTYDILKNNEKVLGIPISKYDSNYIVDINIGARALGYDDDIIYKVIVNYGSLEASAIYTQKGDTLSNFIVTFDDSRAKIKINDTSFHFYAYADSANDGYAATYNDGSTLIYDVIGGTNQNPDINISTYIDVYRGTGNSSTKTTLDVTSECTFDSFTNPISTTKLTDVSKDTTVVRIINAYATYKSNKSSFTNTSYLDIYQLYNRIESTTTKDLKYLFHTDPSIISGKGGTVIDSFSAYTTYYSGAVYTSKYINYSLILTTDNMINNVTWYKLNDWFNYDENYKQSEPTVFSMRYLIVNENTTSYPLYMLIGCRIAKVSAGVPYINFVYDNYNDSYYKNNINPSINKFNQYYQVIKLEVLTFNITWADNFDEINQYNAAGEYYGSENTISVKNVNYGTSYGDISKEIKSDDNPKYTFSLDEANGTFDGWYTDATGGLNIATDASKYTVTSDTTFYAHWKITCTVTLVATPGVFSDGTSYVDINDIDYIDYNAKMSTITSSLKTPTYTTTTGGKTNFAGWYTVSYGKGTLIVDKNNLIVNDISIWHNMCLYAYYTYSLRFIPKSPYSTFKYLENETSPWYDAYKNIANANIKTITYGYDTSVNTSTFMNEYFKSDSTLKDYWLKNINISKKTLSTQIKNETDGYIYTIDGWYQENDSSSTKWLDVDININYNVDLYAVVTNLLYKITVMYNLEGINNDLEGINNDYILKDTSITYDYLFKNDELYGVYNNEYYCIGMSENSNDTSGVKSYKVTGPKKYYLIWNQYVEEPIFLY